MKSSAKSKVLKVLRVFKIPIIPVPSNRSHFRPL